jgi:hypothetical protein
MWPSVLGYCPAERWINFPVSGGKQTTSLSFTILAVLIKLHSISFLSWKTHQSLTITSIPITWYSHNYAWKYGVWYSVMYCIGLAPNITLIQDKKWITLPHLFWNIVILHRLRSFHCVSSVSIVEQLQYCWSILSSPIPAIQLCKCLKSHHWPLRGFLSSPATELVMTPVSL